MANDDTEKPAKSPSPEVVRISKTMWHDAQGSAMHENLVAGLPMVLNNGGKVVVYDDTVSGEPTIGRIIMGPKREPVFHAVTAGEKEEGRFPVEREPERIPMDVPPATQGPTTLPDDGEQEGAPLEREPFKTPTKAPKTTVR